jgi:hypothetical protein
MTGKKKPDSGYRAFADEQQMAYYTVDADTMSARQMDAEANYSWKTL